MEVVDFYGLPSQQYGRGFVDPRAAVSKLNNGAPDIVIPESTPSQLVNNLNSISKEREVQKYNEIAKQKEAYYNQMMNRDIRSANNKSSGLGNSDSIIAASGSQSPFSQDNYYKKLAKHESGGDYNAYNPSGATGKYQFFESTAAPYLKKSGKTWDEFKSSPELQESVVRSFTNDNIAGLKRAGIPINDLSIYAAHQQGLQGAINMYKNRPVISRNIASNIPKGMDPTGQNWMNFWGKRF